MPINQPPNDNGIIVKNMTLHYSSLIKKGCNNLGSDKISKSIFAQLDLDKSGKLDKEEIANSKETLSEIITNIAQKYKKELSKLFGENYSETLSKAENNPEIENKLKPSEKVLHQNIQDAHEEIINYSNNNPEDKQLQEYLANSKNVKFKLCDASDKEFKDQADFAQNIAAVAKVSKEEIKFNKTIINLDKTQTIKYLLHELGHYSNGDDLDSVTEEKAVERYAVETTEKITGEELVKDKDEYIEKFGKIYSDQGYPDHSPGYSGIPKNSGIMINGDIETIDKNGNQTKIVSDLYGDKYEYEITMGNEKDAQGNPYPEDTNLTINKSDGDIEKYEMRNYDKKAKAWKDIKQTE